MPQIWMTYQELGKLCGFGADEARLQAQQLLLDRRRSRDGHTRVKLNAMLTICFIETIRKSEFDSDEAVAALRDTHREMARGFSPRSAAFRRGA